MRLKARTARRAACRGAARREMAALPMTKQSAADLWDRSRRPLRDAMSRAMRESVAGQQDQGLPALG